MNTVAVIFSLCYTEVEINFQTKNIVSWMHHVLLILLAILLFVLVSGSQILDTSIQGSML